MSSSLTIPLAVEKALFRLAVLEGGVVPLARLFIELPLGLEQVEAYADKVADGRAVVKDEWGEFLGYQFPELQGSAIQAPEDCPTCGGEAPQSVTDGGEEVRATLLCDVCYEAVREALEAPEAKGALGRVRRLFGEKKTPDVKASAQLDHEIVYLASRQEGEFTHTSVAAQSRSPSQALKERLDRLGSRRYLQVGLTASGDSVGYRLPDGLSYPAPHYRRFRGTERPSSAHKITTKSLEAAVEADSEPKSESSPLKIVIKGRRDRR